MEFPAFNEVCASPMIKDTIWVLSWGLVLLTGYKTVPKHGSD